MLRSPGHAVYLSVHFVGLDIVLYVTMSYETLVGLQYDKFRRKYSQAYTWINYFDSLKNVSTVFLQMLCWTDKITRLTEIAGVLDILELDPTHGFTYLIHQSTIHQPNPGLCFG